MDDDELLWPYITADSAAQTTAPRLMNSRLLARNAEDAWTIVDLGCGPWIGEHLSHLNNQDCIIGVDILDSPERARTKGCDDVLVLFDGVLLPFQCASVDAVYSRQVFEHVVQPVQLLKEVARVLRPGGKILGSTSHLEPYHSRSVQNFTPYGFARLLEACGFGDVRLYPGIDGLSLIFRRLTMSSGLRLLDWAFDRESVLNFLINMVVPKKDSQRRALKKLLYSGHFCFEAVKERKAA